MSKNIDREKIEFTVMLYEGDWHSMSAYDNDNENITWHIENCMKYITLLSEDVVPQWNAPPDLELLSGDWNEAELLTLYSTLLPAAVKRGYVTDAGMAARIKRALTPRRIRVRRKV